MMRRLRQKLYNNVIYVLKVRLKIRGMELNLIIISDCL